MKDLCLPTYRDTHKKSRSINALNKKYTTPYPSELRELREIALYALWLLVLLLPQS